MARREQSLFEQAQAAQLLSSLGFGMTYNLVGKRFIGTTEYTPQSGSHPSQMALIQNPANSGVWVFFDKLEFGAIGATSLFTRYGGGVATVTGAPQPVGKTDGTAVEEGEGLLRIYRPERYNVTKSGVPRKVAPMKDASPYFATPEGAMIMRPGQQAYWLAVAAIPTPEPVPVPAPTPTPTPIPTPKPPKKLDEGGYVAYINFEWVELDSVEAEAMAAETRDIILPD